MTQIVLVEDLGWERLRPLTWLRPVGELFVGTRTNRERWRDAAGTEPVLWCRTELAGLSPHWVADAPIGAARRLWVRDGLVPGGAWARDALGGTAPTAWRNGDRILAVRTDRAPVPGISPNDPAFWEGLAEEAGSVDRDDAAEIRELPDLVRLTERRIVEDVQREIDAVRAAPADPASPGGISEGAVLYRADRIGFAPEVRIDDGVVLDARDGPIFLGAETHVFPHTWIRGPFACRERCLLLGGRIGGGSFLGAGCRVRGEVEATCFHGLANKAHDGFVGHSYVAEWVNLGAGTTTSDLKNNYGEIRLHAYGRTIESGQIKIGAFIGDHAKTRIGALLNSGSVIGLGANVFGERAVFPKWMPDYAWGIGAGASIHQWDRFVGTARTVATRRGLELGAGAEAALRIAYDRSRAEGAGWGEEID
ncbi:MAG: hypothetical protein GF346_01500 [Candidatus Eisenbacteria bacterium]|nr:hypothetical protein [Candidatus Latescibacterota bacterium]MBD3301105.1 hypothetical protein [Candidatus Eisenbacteria bacterium]